MRLNHKKKTLINKRKNRKYNLKGGAVANNNSLTNAATEVNYNNLSPSNTSSNNNAGNNNSGNNNSTSTTNQESSIPVNNGLGTNTTGNFQNELDLKNHQLNLEKDKLVRTQQIQELTGPIRKKKLQDIKDTKETIAVLTAEIKVMELNLLPNDRKNIEKQKLLDTLINNCSELKEKYDEKHEEVLLLSRIIKFMKNIILNNMSALTGGLSDMQKIYKNIDKLDKKDISNKMKEQKQKINSAKQNIKNVLNVTGSSNAQLQQAYGSHNNNDFMSALGKYNNSRIALAGKKNQTKIKRKKKKSKQQGGSLKKDMKNDERKINKEIDELKSNVFYFIKSLDDSSVEASKFYILILGYLQDMIQSIDFISINSYAHVNNNHKQLKFNQIRDLKTIDEQLQQLLQSLEHSFKTEDFQKIDLILNDKQVLLDTVSELISKQIIRIRTTETSPKNSKLYFALLLETNDLVKSIMSLLELFKEFNKLNKG